ncbi:MAG: hypothetical protein CL992_00770 [Euryarchaeota archaeon]|nr:hypothetical protein [Euryarchaeota archaeon]
MVGRRRLLALGCAILASILFTATGHSQASPPIHATLVVESGNNTVGTGPATFRLELSSLDANSHEVEIFWELEAQNGTIFETLLTNSTVSNAPSEELWNHSSLSEGLWTVHVTLSSNGSSTWAINLSAELIHFRPAQIVVLPSATWDVKWNEPGGGLVNGTPSSGDDIDISIRVENLGDVAANLFWTLQARHGASQIGNATGNVSVEGGERALVGPLSLTNSPEGVVTLILAANTSGQANITTSVELAVGPPPLPFLHTALEEETNRLISRIWNNGTVPARADITCTHDSNIVVEVELALLEAGSLTEVIVTLDPTDGTYACVASPSSRIHANSVTVAQLTLSKSMPNWSLLGDPIAVEGPRHVSDIFELRVPITNSGPVGGNVSLRLIQDGTPSAGNSVPVAAGSSEVLSTSTILSSEGHLVISWEILDADSNVVHEQGTLHITVLPPQILELVSAEVASSVDTTYELSAILSLSPGTSRLVEFEVTSEGLSHHFSYQQVHPGDQTIQLSLPQVDSNGQLLLILRQSGWGNSAAHSLALDVNHPDPTADISIIGGWPDQVLPGDVLTIQAEIDNTGQAALAEGVLRATRATDGFLLAEKATPYIGVGESALLILDLEEWPNGPGTTVIWHYLSENGADAEHQAVLTLPRQEVTASKSLSEDFEFRDVQVGAALGIIGIALIAIGRAVVRSPSFIERGGKESHEEGRATEESSEREVQCPSCDQRLTVPAEYRGRARCTRCGEVFSAAPPDEIEEEEKSTNNKSENALQEQQVSFSPDPQEDDFDGKALQEILESSSSNDVIQCPSCSQNLRVPLNRRPAKARCPACASTFMALSE